MRVGSRRTIYPRVSLYALMLAASGLPLYIHLPLFASAELGIGLGTIGSLLLAIRIVDLVQDPLIGWSIDRWPGAQVAFAFLAAGGLATGFPLLFSIEAGPQAVWHLLASLILLFSAYSLGMILLYGRSATLAARPDARELMNLAAWREAGMLAGVVLAAMLPTLLPGSEAEAYRRYGWILGGTAAVIAVASFPMWRKTAIVGSTLSVSGMTQAGAVRLLAIALVNSLPVAVTSTLFLFFVDARLELPELAGVFLILFFVSAGVSVPFWAGLSNRIGARGVLLIAMPLAILGFAGAAFVGPGAVLAFALICIASGAALGADMVVLPAMFSVALTRAGLSASTAFGIWSFAGKLGLALAAALVLPLLSWAGYEPGSVNSERAISALTLAYAVLPCGLKVCALVLVFRLASKDAAEV